MSNFVWGGKTKYPDFLKAKLYMDINDYDGGHSGNRYSQDMSHATRQIIASNEALAEENIRLLDSGLSGLTTDIDSKLDRISYEMKEATEGITAKFHWGMSQLFARTGRMNDSLYELIKFAKTPAQTAAYEQYEIARDAFRQELYLECLEALDKAINGDHTSTGYKLEWRFHQMKGTLHLGFMDYELSFVDLVKAEESFLLAARYARADYPEHSGQAFLSAGWAAYCQGRMVDALAHTEQAIAVHPKLGEAFFQAAKINMALGETEVAMPILAKAIDLDRLYALKAASDGDFQKQDDRLRVFLESLRKEKYQQSTTIVRNALKQIRFVLEHSPQAMKHPNVQRIKSFLTEGGDWPLIDMLGIIQNIDNLLADITTLPITIKIKGPERECEFEESFQEEEAYEDFENYSTEQKYQEEVIVKPAGLFRKAVTEMQTKTRTVTNKRPVTKIRIVKKNRTVLQKVPSQEIPVDFCLIPAGSFMMGFDLEITESHFEVIDYSFYMSKYPVTQALWESVVGSNPSKFKGQNLPVENVSFYDCQKFISKLNEQEGANLYRFPTVIEWEYACYGRSRPLFYWENQKEILKYGWIEENSNQTTHPVGEKLPNEFGLFDMYGNVSEFRAISNNKVEQHFHDLGDIDELLIAPNGGGGSFSANEEYLFLADCYQPIVYKGHLSGMKPTECNEYHGFRLVRDIVAINHSS